MDMHDDFLNGYPRLVSSPMKGINWYNYIGQGAYWYARSKWRGEMYQAIFRPNDFGGSVESAMEAAITWLVETNAAIGKPTTNRQVYAPQDKNVGVRRRKDGETWYWEAFIAKPDGELARTKFSITKHGEEEAYRLAWNWRREHEVATYGKALVGDSPQVNFPVVLRASRRQGYRRTSEADAGSMAGEEIRTAVLPKTTRVDKPVREPNDDWVDEDFVLSL